MIGNSKPDKQVYPEDRVNLEQPVFSDRKLNPVREQTMRDDAHPDSGKVMFLYDRVSTVSTALEEELNTQNVMYRKNQLDLKSPVIPDRQMSFESHVRGKKHANEELTLDGQPHAEGRGNSHSQDKSLDPETHIDQPEHKTRKSDLRKLGEHVKNTSELQPDTWYYIVNRATKKPLKIQKNSMLFQENSSDYKHGSQFRLVSLEANGSHVHAQVQIKESKQFLKFSSLTRYGRKILQKPYKKNYRNELFKIYETDVDKDANCAWFYLENKHKEFRLEVNKGTAPGAKITISRPIDQTSQMFCFVIGSFC